MMTTSQPMMTTGQLRIPSPHHSHKKMSWKKLIAQDTQHRSRASRAGGLNQNNWMWRFQTTDGAAGCGMLNEVVAHISRQNHLYTCSIFSSHKVLSRCFLHAKDIFQEGGWSWKNQKIYVEWPRVGSSRRYNQHQPPLSFGVWFPWYVCP